MVRQYYVPQVTELSEQELQAVFEAAEPPVCLLGGWAVHFHVNSGFQSEHGREYIGSRDIDIGIHVDTEWSKSEIIGNSVGQTLEAIEDLGYNRSRFGFNQAFHRDDNERLSPETAQELPQHEIFEVYIDIIPDTTELDTFHDAFGFRPPAEPLLKPVFEDSQGQSLSEFVSWEVPGDAEIVPPELLAAMKIRSFPDRDKSHKQVKDIADLHALLWYTKPYNKIKEQVENYVEEDLGELESVVTGQDTDVFQDAGNLLGIDSETIRASIDRLF